MADLGVSRDVTLELLEVLLQHTAVVSRGVAEADVPAAGLDEGLPEGQLLRDALVGRVDVVHHVPEKKRKMLK